jgi:long-chain acyl-CoA synthetase
MGRNALTSLADGLPRDHSPVVVARRSGVWGSETPRFAEEVRELAAALSTYGLTATDSAVVLGAEDTDTLRAALAVLLVGARLVPLDPSIGDDALHRVLESTGAVHAIAHDERQLHRILALRPELPALELVLLMTAAPSERRPPALLVASALEVGAARLLDDPQCLSRGLVDAGEDPACLLTDTRGEGRRVSRDAFLALTSRIEDALGLTPGSTVVSALPGVGVERLCAVLAFRPIGPSRRGSLGSWR